MIAIKNLRKSFGQNEVLKDIRITIQDGEVYGLIGVSGAGKSTLLRCINGLESYDGGSLKIDGTELSELKGRRLRQFRSGIGMIFQQFNLMDRMTVYQNIAFPMRCWGKSREEIDRRVEELLTLVELEEKRSARPRELSGGQKQRVAIARALTMSPKILLCDEATSALDPNITRSILDLLKKINRELGLTIIVVTHQMDVVKQVCGRVSVLSKGVLTCTGDVKDVFLKQPEELEEMLTDERNVELPREGVNLALLFRPDNDAALLARMALETEIPYNMVWSKLDQYATGAFGCYTINIPEDDLQRMGAFLDKAQIEWRVI